MYALYEAAMKPMFRGTQPLDPPLPVHVLQTKSSLFVYKHISRLESNTQSKS